ncbi:MAG: hypothetical protein COB16_05050 [Rhodobacteraceae bacterium]|nr:MAG: hypothetical protein COB16_05050 [Paracoccaceae bacterium]
MIPEKTSEGEVLKVNAKLLSAFVLGGAAWWLIPSKSEMWGLNLLSILLGLAASRKFVEAFLAIRKIRVRMRAVSAMKQDTVEPKSSSLVSEDALRKAGMIE